MIEFIIFLVGIAAGWGISFWLYDEKYRNTLVAKRLNGMLEKPARKWLTERITFGKIKVYRELSANEREVYVALRDATKAGPPAFFSERRV